MASFEEDGLLPPVAMLREQLEYAYARDLPIHLTEYAEPRILGRFPIHYSRMLPFFYAQKCYDRVQAGPTLLKQPQHRRQRKPVGGGGEVSAGGRDEALLEDELAVAIGADEPYNVDVHLRHYNDIEKRAMEASGRPLDPLGEVQKETRDRLIAWLLRRHDRKYRAPSRTSASAAAVVASGGGGGEHREEEGPGVYEHGDLFFGMRQIPQDSPQFITTLYACATPLGPDGITKAMTTAQSEVHDINSIEHTAEFKALPSYVKSLMLTASVRTAAADASSSAAAGGGKSKDGTMASASTAPPAIQVEEYSFNPIVKSRPDDIMDSLVAPRLLFFFTVDPSATEREYERRAAHQRKLQSIYEEYQGYEGGNAHLLKEMDEERRALEGSDPVVGSVLVLMERASLQQASRDALLLLEQDVEEQLREARARCWGIALHTNPQSANFLGTAKGATAVARSNMFKRTLHNKKAAGSAGVKVISTGGAGATATGGVSGGGGAASQRGSIRSRKGIADGRGISNGKDGALGAAAGSGGNNVFYQTVKVGEFPTALDREAGGTATVQPTLNLVELSNERTIVQFHLLGAELLRQVTLELPELGVLLRRVFNEAELSMAARAALVSESVAFSKRHLMDSQEERAEMAVTITQLKNEIDALRQQLSTLQERKRAFTSWVAERIAASDAKAVQEAKFRETLLDRLKRHTEEIKAAQDRERRGSLLSAVE